MVPGNDGLIIGSTWQNEQIEEKDKLIRNLSTEITELKVRVATLDGNLDHYKNQSGSAQFNFLISNIFTALGTGLTVADYENISIIFFVGFLFILLGIMFHEFGRRSFK